jgi:hypothetical protein
MLVIVHPQDYEEWLMHIDGEVHRDQDVATTVLEYMPVQRTTSVAVRATI